MKRAGAAAVAVALVALGLGGCDDDPAGESDGGSSGKDSAIADGAMTDGPIGELPPGDAAGPGDVGPAGDTPGAPSMIDLVFLVDNSVSMEEEQANLARNFPRLVSVLQQLPGGLPDLRIAILSSNFGAGNGHPAEECSGYGDRGRFKVRPGCGLMTGAAWLAVDGSGKANFPGELATTFSCLASLGTSGCGYEHHLQSLRVAFAPQVTPENVGFLRDQAYLGIVILADEDDCSADPTAEFFRDPVPGQAGGLRCALKGHTCMGQPVPATIGFSAPLSSCQPAEHPNTDLDRRERLLNVKTFVDDIKALKPNREDHISISVIVGWDENPAAAYRIVGRGSPPTLEADLAPICSSPGTGSAAPGIRLRNFAQSFSRHTVHSICSDDLGPAMAEIGRRLAGMMAP